MCILSLRQAGERSSDFGASDCLAGALVTRCPVGRGDVTMMQTPGKQAGFTLLKPNDRGRDHRNSPRHRDPTVFAVHHPQQVDRRHECAFGLSREHGAVLSGQPCLRLPPGTPAGPRRPATEVTIFTFTCTIGTDANGTAGQGYTAQAAGNAGTPVAGLTYQIDYQNNRTTPNVPSRMDRSNHELLGN